jgi:DNA-binding NtrC family response regulator
MKRFGTTARAEQPPEADAAGDHRAWHLIVAHGPPPAATGEDHHLQAQRVHLGRDPEPGPHARVLLGDDRVSRLHAAITLGPAGASLADRGSTNGSLVDGVRVDSARLAAGSVIRLGDTLLVAVRGQPAAPGSERDLGLVGRAPALAALREVIRKLAPATLPVLIAGETGTGKELVARALHRHSGRPGAFVPLNCAALPTELAESLLFGHRRGAYTGATSDQEGAFVRAHQGTLFLDEIGELPAPTQSKLLRVLEDGEVMPVGSTHTQRVAVRVVAASNVPLAPAVRAGRFRQDLLARLAGVVLESPPLRERREDVLPLFAHFAAAAARIGEVPPLSPDLAEALLLHDWPGNVRELGKLAERLAVLHPGVPRWELAMLDESLRLRVQQRGAADPAATLRARRGPPSRDELVALLARFDGNVSLLARHVDRNRKQVYRWMVELGIERDARNGPHPNH